MQPQVYSLGATVLVQAQEGAGDGLAASFAGNSVEFDETRLESALAGVNLLQNGDFSTDDIRFKCGDAQVRIGRDISPDWTLQKNHVAFVELPDGVARATVSYGDPVFGERLPVAAGMSFVLSAFLAAHRCSAAMCADYFDHEGKHLGRETEPCVELPQGGTALNQYKAVHLECHVPAGAAYMTLSLDVANAQAGTGEGAYLFMAFARAYLSPGKLTRGWTRSPAGLFSLIEAVAHKGQRVFRPSKSLTRHGDAGEISVLLDGQPVGEPVQLAPLPVTCKGVMLRGRRLNVGLYHPDEGSLADVFADYLRPSAAGAQIFVDGELDTLAFAHKTAAPHFRDLYVRLSPHLYDGKPHHIEVISLDGHMLAEDVLILSPNALDLTTVKEHTRAPYKSQMSALAGLRYRSLEAQLARADVLGADGVAQVGFCHNAVVHGFDRNKDFRPLTFPKVKDSKVSVIVPVHNKFEVTYNCLAALLFAYNETPFDVVIVDDGSSDRTLELGALVHNITVVRHDKAKGFVGACNAGADAARGDFLIFLNNDTEVTYRWLDEMMFTFKHFDNVGLVGAKLIYPDGVLQEAGGIIWAEGEGWNYGRNGNPHEPKYNYVRPVHYCSGAAIAVSRAAWDAVGGFARDFEPAYYEDTDLAFTLRKHGYRTLYNPLSVVVHFEGVSNGTEVVSSGMKRFQAINKPKFLKRHEDVLATAPVAGEGAELYKDQGVDKRVLFIDYQVPRTDYDAGSYAAIQEMRMMQALGYKVTFLPDNLAWLGKYVDQLQRIGVEVIYAPFYVSTEEFLADRGGEFDVVYMTRYYVAQDNIKQVRKYAPQAKVLFNNADLHFLREARAAVLSGSEDDLRKARKTRKDELAVMKKVDLLLSYNDVEHAVVLSHNFEETKIAKAPWVVDTAHDVAPFESRTDIAFLGGYGHPPNIEAMQYFAREVMPLLREKGADFKLHIYGSNMCDTVRELACDDVIVVGHVEDVADVYARHRVFVAPLLSGAGIKGKVLAAMAHGIPTVLSRIAAEGTGVRHGYDCEVADKAEAWAMSTMRLYSDKAYWNDVSERSRAFIQAQYSFEVATGAMRDALAAVDAPHETDSSGLVINSSTMMLEP